MKNTSCNQISVYPVSIEELERYDGEPVWVRSRNSMYSGKWGIVDALRQTIDF